MSEILYRYNHTDAAVDASYSIRWLSRDDLDVFSEHLRLCGQRVLDKNVWNKMYDDGTVYCGLFIDGKMVSRACVEKYSDAAWEVADVRTARDLRNRGYAYQVCLFVLKYIDGNGVLATMRTEADNYVMQKVIDKLGFIES